LKDFDVHYLRSRFGVVSQEPVLFNGSFAENIQYNKEDATAKEIESAASKANALPFIVGEEDTGMKSSDGKSGF
jgi:ATP-binding cassette subfamily B (MDR/TAP) protein 1